MEDGAPNKSNRIAHFHLPSSSKAPQPRSLNSNEILSISPTIRTTPRYRIYIFPRKYYLDHHLFIGTKDASFQKTASYYISYYLSSTESPIQISYRMDGDKSKHLLTIPRVCMYVRQPVFNKSKIKNPKPGDYKLHNVRLSTWDCIRLI